MTAIDSTWSEIGKRGGEMVVMKTAIIAAHPIIVHHSIYASNPIYQ